ncbi:hypothetical protein [Phytopseudomonas flavescens]|nr:hypothetical protein [Pseudomonas flavescens]
MTKVSLSIASLSSPALTIRLAGFIKLSPWCGSASSSITATLSGYPIHG